MEYVPPAIEERTPIMALAIEQNSFTKVDQN